jgi:hypothetical protein
MTPGTEGIRVNDSRFVVIENCTFRRRKPWRILAAIEVVRVFLVRWLPLVMLVFIVTSVVDIYFQYQRLQSQNRMTAVMIELGKRVDIIKAQPAQIGSPR